MTINITKKQIIIAAAVIAGLVVVILAGGAIKNANYKKNAKKCQENLYGLYSISSYASALIHDTWSEYIFKDKEYFDSSNGKFYERYDSFNRPGATWCEDFNDAIAHKRRYMREKGVYRTIDSLYRDTKAIMTKMTPPPSKYNTIHNDINTLYRTVEGMYNCASSPEGNLRSYTEMINRLSADYKIQMSQVDIEIGEVDKETQLEWDIRTFKLML